ncbi:MAG TPA: hypothetical protein VE594_01045 [Nitrososphaeraceae archaeon]|jgi:hypothetical protein|nr:hypothetical protein [Nitrososphaeraceae archaeon]
MDFQKLEDLANEVNLARNQNMRSKAAQIEEEILKSLTENELIFPVEQDVLINKNSASFLYKNNKTYPALLEFMARILHVDIPIRIRESKFGPGGIIVVAGNKDQANKILQECCNELQFLIKGKEGHLD